MGHGLIKQASCAYIALTFYLRCANLFRTIPQTVMLVIMTHQEAMSDSAVAAKRTRDIRGRRSRIDIYANLEDALEQLNRVGGLPSPTEAEGIWGDIWYAEAHNSTAIEGNTLVLREVEALLRDGRAVGNKQLRDYLEVLGYGKAAQWVYQQALNPIWNGTSLLTLVEVRQIHALIMGQVWDVEPHPQATPEEKPGNFRRHDIQPFSGGMTPPSWTSLDSVMFDWVDKVCAGPDKDQPVTEVIADWFAEFERVHPFLDGNGRTGRLLTNLILIRLGYPPAIIYKRQRSRYLKCLQSADIGVPGPLGELLARAIIDTLHQFVFPAVAGPFRLVPLASLADKEVTMRALRDAAERGRLKAQRDKNGQWQSMRRWVDEYKTSRHRGPPKQAKSTLLAP